MARIAGIQLPNEKRIVIALTYIFGVGSANARKILDQANVDENVRTKDLSGTQANRIREIIEKKYRVEGDLKREMLMNIKRLKDISSYRGSRHTKGLPVRGQRTKTNTRTVRGNVRRTMASGRRSATEKT